MIIKNAQIVLLDKIIKGYIEFDNNKIISINEGKTNKPGFDAKNLYLLPSYFDTHTHGGYGLDFNMLKSNEYLKHVKTYFKNIKKEGVSSVLLTTVTCSDEDLNAIALTYKEIKAIDKDNIIKGWYIEGPYISIDKKGAHDPRLIRPIDLQQLDTIHKLTPNVIKVLAVAPEFRNNVSKFNKINNTYFLSTGHSNANYQQAIKGFNLKANRIIHMYNAMPNFDKREPTLFNAIINRDDVICELICDGAHVAPEVILNTYKMIGSDRIMVISDCLLTKGLKDGTYNVWNTEVDKRGMLDYLKGTNSIAGGNLPFNKQVENYGKITKCSMMEILKVSSYNAAKKINQDNKFGNLIVGAESSFVLIDKNYQLKHTFIRGKQV